MDIGEIYPKYVHADCGGDLAYTRMIGVHAGGGGGEVPEWECQRCGKCIDATEYWLFEKREMWQLRSAASSDDHQGRSATGGATE
jgi:hypothetical protein